MLPQWIIEKKRDGHALTTEEIHDFIAGYTTGSVPDYQAAALAMAIYFRGMTFDEVAALTDAMMHSGATLSFPELGVPTADKHSTGGIGDKVSLILAPLVACCDVAVPMLSGRSLGITGGTLDKLEAIPGYRTDLSVSEFHDVLKACGCSIMGQTAELAPADRKLYALRDVTGTVPSIPLISASIMCKKLAEGADSLVLDVKWGKGAFMKAREDAERLAHTMVEIGTRMGRRMAALITDMNQPLGRAVGNATEVGETVEALQGRGPDDLMEVTLALATRMLLLTGRSRDATEARALLEGHLASGSAFERFCRMVDGHGGDVSVLAHPDRLPQATIHRDVTAGEAGTVAGVDADRMGRAAILLGGGRAQVSDTIDPAVGITGIAKIGEHVERGQPLMQVHANDDARFAAAMTMLSQAVTIVDAAVEPPTLIGRLIEATEAGPA